MAKKTPLRKCVGCGEMIVKKELLRVIRTPDGEIKVDPTGKQNGRGAYIHSNQACFEQARKTKGFERSFKMSIDADIYERLLKEMMMLDK